MIGIDWLSERALLRKIGRAIAALCGVCVFGILIAGWWPSRPIFDEMLDSLVQKNANRLHELMSQLSDTLAAQRSADTRA